MADNDNSQIGRHHPFLEDTKDARNAHNSFIYVLDRCNCNIDLLTKRYFTSDTEFISVLIKKKTHNAYEVQEGTNAQAFVLDLDCNIFPSTYSFTNYDTKRTSSLLPYSKC